MTATNELPALIDNIIATHHAFTREILPRINTDLRALRDHPDAAAKEKWEAVFKSFFNLKMEIQEHLMKEENILFPTIKSLAEGKEPAMACGVEGPIKQMEFEHVNAHKALDTIADICVGLKTMNSDELAAEWKRALEDLAALDSDLREHIRKEEEEVFPHAMTM